MGLRKKDRGGDALDDLGRNDLAGSAPCSEAVEHDERVLLLERLLPVGLSTRAKAVSGLFCVLVVADRSRRGHDVVGCAPVRHDGGATRDRGATHEARLWTPSLLIAAVLEKNLGVKSGR